MLELTNQIKQAFLDKFPNGLANSSKGSLSGDTFISFYLINNSQHQLSKMMDNDPLSLQVRITKNGDKYEMDWMRKLIATEPTEKFMAMGHKRLQVRKATGTASNILKRFTMATERLETALIELGDNIYKASEIQDQYKTWLK